MTNWKIYGTKETEERFTLTVIFINFFDYYEYFIFLLNATMIS